MPSLRGKLLNWLNRRYVRRSYGMDEFTLAEKSRHAWGSPPFWQWLHSRGVFIEQINEAGVRGEWLATRDAASGDGAVIFYIHGGGFVACSARTHRPITATLARETNFPVFSLKYRLAPEARFPAALDDVYAAYEWLTREKGVAPSKIAVAGDSAGGGLALSLILRLREKKMPLPACAATFSPWTDLAGTGASRETNAERDAMFCPENNAEFANAYFDNPASAKNPLASPFYGDFREFPPVLFHVGSTEMLLDDSRRIHEKIRAAGGVSELEIYEDIFHCWQMTAGFVPEAGDSLRKAAAFMRRHVRR